MQSLETQLLKASGYLPSQHDCSRDPPPFTPAIRFPLHIHRRWVLDKRGAWRRMCTGKQTQAKLEHGMHVQHDAFIQSVSPKCKPKKLKTYCMGWQDWAFCSPGPRWRGEDQVHLVLVRAQLHASGSSWVTAVASAAFGCMAAGKASEWPPVLLHGSSHSSTPLWHIATWRVQTSQCQSQQTPCPGLIAVAWF